MSGSLAEINSYIHILYQNSPNQHFNINTYTSNEHKIQTPNFSKLLQTAPNLTTKVLLWGARGGRGFGQRLGPRLSEKALATSATHTQLISGAVTSQSVGTKTWDKWTKKYIITSIDGWRVFLVYELKVYQGDGWRVQFVDFVSWEATFFQKCHESLPMPIGL